MGLTVVVNGRERTWEQLGDVSGLNDVVGAMDLKADRVAVELNGTICSRAQWDQTQVRSGDRLEIVHFVGGGLATPPERGFASSAEKRLTR
jgi:sulfur carrier protein